MKIYVQMIGYNCGILEEIPMKLPQKLICFT